MRVSKSKSLRRVFVKTPGGKTVARLKSKTGTQATCPVTGQKLQGTPKVRPSGLRNMAKSKKKPSRLFGGMLSSSAARREIIRRARVDE
jgi:large subunit ribosomal protein L34e